MTKNFFILKFSMSSGQEEQMRPSRKKMEIPFAVGGEDLEQRADMVLLFKSYESINPENIGDLAVLAKRLWNDAGVKETFRRRFVKKRPRGCWYVVDCSMLLPCSPA